MNENLEKFILPWVRETQGYSDKHIDQAWDNPELSRLMSNENPCPPSEAIRKAVEAELTTANLYPGSGRLLREALGRVVGISAENIVLGNGSTDVLNTIVHTFVGPNDQVIIPIPTFSIYESRTRLAGGKPILIPIGPGHRWNTDLILAATNEETKLIILCTPSNPIGISWTEESLCKILEAGYPTVIDEAYYEMQDTPFSAVKFMPDWPNAIVTRTFSKAYGLAGLRIGYAVADEEVCIFLNRVRMPWNVSSVSLAAALAALQEEIELHRKVADTRKGREYLFDEINKIEGIEAYPSQGNFVLFNIGGLNKSSDEITEFLLRNNVFIRPMSRHQMDGCFLRVTVGTFEENQRFVRILREYSQYVRRPPKRC